MSKRLQVLLEESQLRDIRRVARSRQLTVSEWVRQVLWSAAASDASQKPAKKLAALYWAARHQYPTGDINQMLAEIEGKTSE